MEKIISIKEVDFKKDKYTTFSGFEIKTTEQIIQFGIYNKQCCCEDWGYFITNDTTDEFINAVLLDVKIVDECLNTQKTPDLYEGGVMFVNIETSVGTLQFTAYNSHNGYYGHDAVIYSNQLTEEWIL